MQKSNASIFGIGLVGFLLGGFISFLARPSVFLGGQVPFVHVITRGALLEGFDKMVVPLAQQSFNIMLVGAVIGAVAAIVIANYLKNKKAPQGDFESPAEFKKMA